jgi:hypothetical protein
LETVLVPPHENGVIWSYSRLSELPQHLQMPPSLVKTIFFVVAEMYRLWEKQAALKNKIVNNKNNFLMLLLAFKDKYIFYYPF